MKKVYCKNCRYGVKYGFITIDDILCLIQLSIYNAICEDKLDRPLSEFISWKINKKKKCSFYKRKWWKFWA